MIKHGWFINLKGKKKYVCNQAVDVKDEKLAKNSDEVNCKNCLDMCQGYTIGEDERKYLKTFNR